MIHGYVRVSTDGQNEGWSPEEQEFQINLIVQFKRTDPTWRDAGFQLWRDTVSGSVLVSEREQGKQMIDSLQRGDLVIAAKLDRLFRNAEDALARSRSWRETGIDLILADMGTEPVTTSAAGRLYFGMLAQFAEFERERIRERTIEGRVTKRKQGGFIGGKAPTGYRVVGEGRAAVLEPDETEIEMIAMARHLGYMMRDISPTPIANRLNELGYRSRAGTPIVATQVWRWLRRPIQFEGPEPTEDGGQVYHCFDALGRLRYIGSSVDARKRLVQHKNDFSRSDYLSQDWFAWVERVTIENHPTRKEAYAAETDAQRNEPLFKESMTDAESQHQVARFRGIWRE